MWWPGLGPAATWPLPHKTQGWGQYWGNGQKVSTRLTTSWTQQTDAGAQQSIRFMVNLAKTLFAFKSSYKQTIIEALLLNIISTKNHISYEMMCMFGGFLSSVAAGGGGWQYSHHQSSVPHIPCKLRHSPLTFDWSTSHPLICYVVWGTPAENCLLPRCFQALGYIFFGSFFRRYIEEKLQPLKPLFQRTLPTDIQPLSSICIV